MYCNNKDCKHIFFYREYGYICCPVCGEIQKEKLAQNNFKRVQITEKSLKIKTLVKVRHHILLFTVLSPLISFLLYFLLKDPSMRVYKNSFTLEHLNFCVGLVMLCFMLLFAYFDEKTMLLKKLIDQNAYYLNCMFFKLIKWLILVFALFIVNKYVFPYIYCSSRPEFIADGRPINNLNLIIYIGKRLLIIQSICYVLIDIFEVIKRKLLKI